MRQKLIFKINSKEYEKENAYEKNMKTPYGNKGTNKYYVGYLNDGFK